MIRRAVVLWLVLVSAVFSQAKVGTTGAQFLELPLSARTAGMGNVGVVFLDSRASHVNPAMIAFMDPFQFSLQLDPLASEVYGDLNDYYSLSGAWLVRRATDGGPSIGVAARYLRFTSEYTSENSYQPFIEPQSLYWRDSKAGLAAGLGWSGRIDFGVGVGLHYIRGEIDKFFRDSWCGDAGVFLGIPVRSDNGSSLKPPRLLLGAAINNFGPAIRYGGNRTHLSRYLRLGTGVEIIWRGGGREQLKVVPAVEYEHRYGSSRREYTDIGLEIWAQELLCGRIGHQWLAGVDQDIATWGLGFSTAGLRGRSRGQEDGGGQGVLEFIFNDIDVQVSYAHQSSLYEWWDGTDYYGIELMF